MIVYSKLGLFFTPAKTESRVRLKHGFQHPLAGETTITAWFNRYDWGALTFYYEDGIEPSNVVDALLSLYSCSAPDPRPLFVGGPLAGKRIEMDSEMYTYDRYIYQRFVWIIGNKTIVLYANHRFNVGYVPVILGEALDEV